MRYHVLTLFPEMILQGMQTSIIGRAMEKGILELNAVNIRDFAEPQRKSRIDDYPYGGGAGMVMQAEPVYQAWKHVSDSIGHPARCIYLTPQGTVFDQPMARDFACEEDLILLCGQYEGIDERVLDEIVTDHVSIGDYVLTGGELAAMVLMDAVSRMVPGVLTNEMSGVDESFSDYLLEYPQYSRPEVWHEKKVPQVLISGHHGNVDRWRREQSIQRTWERRPDLLEKAALDQKDRKYLEELLAKKKET